MIQDDLRAIAFYLPQYHPIQENDAWWGRGFTEWRNVTKASPLFPGHAQPHLPADLGFYDLRLPEVRESQATLALQYGIHGFCYYHYWFNGRRILQRPFEEVLASGKPNFPFCLCWANENWTRAWDGGEKEILLGQNYSIQDDRDHIKSLIPALLDRRYIRINDKPLLLVYRTELLPDALATATIWREEAMRAGVGELYLARVEGFSEGINPGDIGFDAAVEFAPDWRATIGNAIYRTPLFRKAVQYGWLPSTYLSQTFIEYETLIEKMLAKPMPDYPKFRCVTPGFDNSARRDKRGAVAYVGSTPELYENWLTREAALTLREKSGDERIIFLNAWNEWAEGNHLEPDLAFGHGYLQATRSALLAARNAGDREKNGAVSGMVESQQPVRAGARREKSALGEFRELLRHIRFWRGKRSLSA